MRITVDLPTRAAFVATRGGVELDATERKARRYLNIDTKSVKVGMNRRDRRATRRLLSAAA